VSRGEDLIVAREKEREEREREREERKEEEKATRAFVSEKESVRLREARVCLFSNFLAFCGFSLSRSVPHDYKYRL